MKIDEKKLIEYLKNHVGENTTTSKLADECSISDDKDFGFETDTLIRKIARDNGFRLNADYHAYDVIGMPWVIDFFIEYGDLEKNIEWINTGVQPRMKAVLIEQEYGLYDNWERLVGFRLSIPWKIKKMYDEISDELEEYENNNVDVD